MNNSGMVLVRGWRLNILFRIEKILRDEGLEYRATRMGMCANTLKIFRDKIYGQISVLGLRCKDRLCPICASFRAAWLAKKVEGLIQIMVNPHFLTLTYGNRVSVGGLKKGLDNFFSRFKALRRLKWWKQNIKGGIFFLEVTYDRGKGWHIHSHMVVDVFGDSKIYNLSEGRVTDFKRDLETSLVQVGLGVISFIVPCNKSASKEVSKYMCKFFIFSDDKAIREAIHAFFNRRVCEVFGSYRGIKGVDGLEEEEEVGAEYESLGSISDVFEKWLIEFGRYSPVVLQFVRDGYIEICSSEYVLANDVNSLY